jgi:transcriptional regulator with XRE-family HTH domain
MEALDYVKALLDSGLTQSEIADRTGIPQPTISKIYRGDIADVLSRNYRKLQALHAEVLAQADGSASAEAAAKVA